MKAVAGLGTAGYFIGSGQEDASLPLSVQGLLKVLAGIFMLVMGLSMLEIFPSLRKFRLRLTASLGKLVGKAVGSGAGPFAV